jgi:hypothetical protein
MMIESVQDTRRCRDRCYGAVREFLSQDDLASVTKCVDRLMDAFPADRPLRDNVVLVAYGGGKDSSYTVTFVRLMQLVIDRSHGETFKIRTVTNWYPGMPPAVLDNIDRAYQALGLYDDPDCELLILNGSRLTPFQRDLVLAPETVERVRLDMLMTGHRTAADARPTFCNTCNLSMVNAFGMAARYGQGVDIIITGDSADEQRSYLRWVARAAQRIGADRTAPSAGAFGKFLVTTNSIAKSYFSDIYGDGAGELLAGRGVATDVPAHLRFFSIYEDTDYASGEHWDLLTKFLGFEFDDVAFSFTESDCGNPALMAHLRGLKCQYVYGRSYAEGITEYINFAVPLMRKKHFPEFLIEVVQDRYATPDAIERMREKMVRYCLNAFCVTEEQLLCMVYAPFGEEAAGLRRYLDEVQPALAGRADEIAALLAGDDTVGAMASREDLTAASREGLTAALERLSGLDRRYLRRLYNSPIRRANAGVRNARDVIGAILDGDPHKAVIKTRHAPDGPVMDELISGR